MDALIRGLLRAEAYDHPAAQFEVLETHISWIILTGEYAYKLKKPVNFGFVDFTTLERRQFFCQEELRLNARLAHDLYLAVKPIYGPRDRPSFVGKGEPIEYAVQMRQFPQSALLTEVLQRGELSLESLDACAVDIARFQNQAAIAGPADPYGTPADVWNATDECLLPLEEVPEAATITRKLCDWATSEHHRLTGEFQRRKHAGKIREGHGDMHLGNMLFRNDRIEVFDCLEFNPTLRWIDTVSEVAFLVMDLAERGSSHLGRRFLNRWLEQTGDYPGLRVWRWYLAYRALVRAKVAQLRRNQPDLSSAERQQLLKQAMEYLRVAQTATELAKPVLILACGVSGSGKSHWTERLVEQSGAIRLRSDVERKRLAGQFGDAPQIIGDLYSADASEKTYQRLLDLAAELLANRFSVIVDATFLRRSQRNLFQQFAVDQKIPHQLIEFRAHPQILRDRIEKRNRTATDPSDATVEVLDRQLQTAEPLTAEEGWPTLTLDTDQPEVENRLLREALVSQTVCE